MPMKTCPRGHTFMKSSACTSCPTCEAARAPDSGFLAVVGAPARRALEREGIDTLAKLATWSEHELLALHGIGPAAIPRLTACLVAAGLSFGRGGRRDPGMRLQTERLVLRRARLDDLDAIHAILSNGEAMRYWSTLPHTTMAESLVWLESMIASPASVSEDFIVEFEGRVVGKAGFFRLPEIGYILHPDVWGRGFAHEATHAIIEHVFSTRDIETLTADVDPRNTSSIALLSRLGFVRTGAAERTFNLGGHWADSIYYALHRGDREPTR